MREATAIEERYRELGFRVIEGGKSGKLVVIDSIHLGIKFNREHKDVLKSIDNTIAEIKSRGANLRHQISEDVRTSTYTDDRGKPWRYYLLTEIGFELIASGWDAVLRYEILIAFRELREEHGRGHSRPVADRLQELRGDWTQGELFPAPTSVPKVQPRRASERWVDDEVPYDYRYKPTGSETWDEIYKNGKRYLASARFWPSDNLLHVSIRFAHLHGGYKPRAWLVPSEPQAYLTWDMGKTPRPILVNALKRFGLYSDLVRDTLDGMFFDDIREKPQGPKAANGQAPR